MTRRKQIKHAPHYHSRLFQTEEAAEEFVSRMKLKMGPSFTYDVSYNDEYELWHGRFWDSSATEEGYIIK